MRDKLRELLRCPLDWTSVTNHPFEGSVLEGDWQYAVGAMAVDPDDIPFDEEWIETHFDDWDVAHAVDVLTNRRDETIDFYKTKCAPRLHKLNFVTPAEHGKHYKIGFSRNQIISRTRNRPSLFLENYASADLRQWFWDWFINYFDWYSDRHYLHAIMDPDQEEYNEEDAKLWRRLLSEPHTRLSWSFDDPIGASKGALTNFICYDIHIDTATAHCYPVSEEDAKEIMIDAELVNSDDYFRPENM
jgi:hypothetical protein